MHSEVEGSELFLFIDNIVAEVVYWKGMSTSKESLNIVLAMKLITVKYHLKLHVVHVAGTYIQE